MKYVSVTSPGSDMSKPIFNYFDDYLISLGEPATSKAWTMFQIVKHMGKIIQEKPEGSNLYIDSGGFQIIVGYVYQSRITEYVDTYHFILEKYKDEIDKIFSLDVWNPHLTDEQVLIENTYSIQESINLIKKYPEIADKQLMVMQSSNTQSFPIWRQMFLDLKVYEHFKLWSIGGLVGLKKSTNSKFSHAVPATLWLLTYQKSLNFTIDQIHWLGQSSRLSFLSMALFTRLYDLYMTSDSSQLVRFAPLEAKLPYLIEHNNEFHLIPTESDVISKMLPLHSIPDIKCYISKSKSGKVKEVKPDLAIDPVPYIKETFDKIKPTEKFAYFSMTPTEFLELTGRLDNVTFIELQSQNLAADLKFGNMIVDLIMEIGIDNVIEEQQLRDLHPVMDRGRTANELMNNINYFKQFKDIVANGDLAAADSIMIDIVNSYIK